MTGAPRPMSTSADPPRGCGPAWERPGARPASHWIRSCSSLERPNLGRHRLDAERLELHRLVVEPIAFAVPERVLHPDLVVAAVRVLGRVGVIIDGVRAAALVAGRRGD